MLAQIIKFLKGIAMGIANVIPGFSGGTMALILKIYEEFVDALADLTKHPLQVIRRSGMLFLGIAVGVVLALFTVKKLLEVIPFITILFFVGLIIGSIPDQVKSSNVQKFKPTLLIPFFFAVLLIVGLPFIPKSGIEASYNLSAGLIAMIFVMGIIASSAMVLPGVSGSMILMIFGYYEFILDTIGKLIKNAVKLNFADIWQPFIITLVFGIGCVAGILFISKLIKKLYVKYDIWWNSAITGLLVASPFAIIYSSYTDNNLLFSISALQYVFAVIAFIAGVFLTWFMCWYSAKKHSKKTNRN